MNKVLKSITLVGLGLVLTASSVSAYKGDPNVQGPNYTPERHEAMEQAFESNDYQAWKELMGDRPATQRITEENFAKFAQMHELREEGNVDEANQIRAELGFGMRDGSGQRLGGRGNGHGCRGGFAK